MLRLGSNNPGAEALITHLSTPGRLTHNRALRGGTRCCPGGLPALGRAPCLPVYQLCHQGLQTESMGEACLSQESWAVYVYVCVCACVCTTCVYVCTTICTCVGNRADNSTQAVCLLQQLNCPVHALRSLSLHPLPYHLWVLLLFLLQVAPLLLTLSEHAGPFHVQSSIPQNESPYRFAFKLVQMK